MRIMIRKKIAELAKKSIRDLQKEGVLTQFEIPEIIVDYPREKGHGEYSTNIALILAKMARKNPTEIAEILANRTSDKIFEKVEAANGFINFFVSEDYLRNRVKEILKQKDKFGNLIIKRKQKINVEFISANPTGPLTLGNGRGGFCGDALANVLAKAGYKVVREYYLNDRGEQIIKLGHSVLGDEQAVYKGKYIDDLRKKLLQGRALQYSVEEVGEKAAEIILDKMIKPTVKRMGISFDVWFSEKSLYVKKEVDKEISELKKKELVYNKDGAVWFKSKKFGDDKDRVLVKTDGEKAYFASDIAYLKNKIKRGFDVLIMFVGADHYGYVVRMKALAEALGFDKDNLKIVVMQMVRLMKDGQEVKMSKRSGIYVTLDELIDEVGLDIARYFFLTRSPNTHLNFDLDLAKEQSEKNPVFYIQYAYARIHSILAKSKIKNQKSKIQIKSQNLKLLKEPSELNLIKQLIKLPEVVEDTERDYQVQRLPQYATDLATAFHHFYRDCRVISEDKKLSEARLSLILAAKIVLKNTLDLMGISAPEKM